MSEHTPGPWRAEFDADGNWYTNRVYAANGDLVANMITSPRWVRQKMHPNTLLIAAAPELLAALESLVFIGRADDFPLDDEWRDAIDRAESAIAKAKGEAS
jgi:hypothetical protein